MATITATIKKQVAIQAKSMQVGTAPLLRLQDMDDVDTTELQEGALLMFENGGFKTTPELSNAGTKIIGGSF